MKRLFTFFSLLIAATIAASAQSAGGLTVQVPKKWNYMKASDGTVALQYAGNKRVKNVKVRVAHPFTVLKDKIVYFSPGNLQYQKDTKKWRFAEHQYDYVGGKYRGATYGNVYEGDTKCDNGKINTYDYKGWIDLFGWGTGDTPLNTSENSASGYKKFNEWGDNLNEGYIWRTLTKDEWTYLIKKRETTNNMRYAKVNVHGVDGLLLLPDDWTGSAYSFNSVDDSDAAFEVINDANWVKIENQGAIFLPVAGKREGVSTYTGGTGYYWSSTAATTSTSYPLEFSSSGVTPDNNSLYRSTGCSVRLVREPKVFSTYTVNGVSFKMVYVEGGTFKMGVQKTDPDGDNYDADAEDYESPVHEVSLSTFSIGETEVTQALWKAVMGADNNPSEYKNDSYPVESVSWNDVQEFIMKLNELTGETFRLPTEAEWEYAARGGRMSKGSKYAGSDDLGKVAWYGSNSSNTPHAVATKAPNELGLYDMSGNVYEWCQDSWDGTKDYSTTPCDGSANTSGSGRVLRGGSWWIDARYCRVSNRSWDAPGNRNIILGFRLAH
ncbi:MAG: formylglycine-generating enzyme family protein [Bacteroidales bacterium]|nr:formylglycine-generating enzyme family protein [Bacteroidales bacterium]